MRTTRLVMLAPFRGRRRTRDRRSRPSPADRSWSCRRRRGRPPRRSSRGGGRRGCRSRRRAGAHRRAMRRSSPSTSIRTPSAVRPAAMPAIRSDSLWRSSPAPRMVVVPRARLAARHRTGISSMASATSAGETSIARSSAERTVRSASGSPTSGSPASPTGRSSMSAPIARSRSMTPRRVGLTPDVAEGQLGIGMDRAGDEPERGRRDVARHPLVDRLHRQPSFERPGDLARSAVRRVQPGSRVPAASAPCDRGSRLVPGPSSGHRPAGRRGGSPT